MVISTYSNISRSASINMGPDLAQQQPKEVNSSASNTCTKSRKRVGLHPRSIERAVTEYMCLVRLEKHRECLRYLLDNNCPLPRDASREHLLRFVATHRFAATPLPRKPLLFPRCHPKAFVTERARGRIFSHLCSRILFARVFSLLENRTHTIYTHTHTHTRAGTRSFFSYWERVHVYIARALRVTMLAR